MSTIRSNGDVNKPPVEPPVERTGVENGTVLSVAGQYVDVSNSTIGSLAAVEVSAENSLILFGSIGTLHGQAQVLISAQAAIALGLAAGASLALLSRLLARRGE